MTDTTPSGPDFGVVMREIVSALAMAMEATEMTLVELSKRTGLSVSALCRLKKLHRTDIKVETMLRVCYGLERDPSWLIHSLADLKDAIEVSKRGE